jgi:hypothetical protein
MCDFFVTCVVVASDNLVTTTSFSLCFVKYTGSRIEILFVISLLLLREVESGEGTVLSFRVPIHPDLPKSPGFMSCKEHRPGVSRNWARDTKCLEFLKVTGIKHF